VGGSVRAALPPGVAPAGRREVPSPLAATRQAPGPIATAVKVTDSSSPQQTQGPIVLRDDHAATRFDHVLKLHQRQRASTAGVYYADTCMASNGIGPFTWSIQRECFCQQRGYAERLGIRDSDDQRDADSRGAVTVIC